jgi:hypothetical protein
MQVPILKPEGPELAGLEFGHTGAATALVITDRCLGTSAGFDCTLCVFSIAKPQETLCKVEHAHGHGITAVAHYTMTIMKNVVLCRCPY